MKKLSLLFTTSVVIIMAIGCSQQTTKVESPDSLKDHFKKDFLIGTALGKSHINQEDKTLDVLLEKEFNAITPENIMKSENIHPGEEEYNFEFSDKYVALGEEYDMSIVGHTLVWHSQLSDWIESISDSATMSMALRDHINTIVGRYKGRINAWDVVNEALNEDGTLRESVFLNVIGEDYLKQAFEATAKVDPAAKLFYNDYNMTKPSKRDGAIRMIKSLQEKGVKIDGVGLQGHWSLIGPSLEEIESAIVAYGALGIDIAFTEVDVTVLPNPWDLEGAEVSQNFEGSPYMNPYPERLPDSIQVQLADRYEDIFKLFLKHQDKISRVTFWGTHDGHSWLNGWPIKNRTNYPLLFDRDYNRKPAYNRVVGLKVNDQD